MSKKGYCAHCTTDLGSKRRHLDGEAEVCVDCWEDIAPPEHKTMKEKIWKYEIGLGVNHIIVPYWSELAHTGKDPQGKLCAWFVVSTPPGEREITRDIKVVFTGEEYEKEWEYHSTVLGVGLVFHILKGWK